MRSVAPTVILAVLLSVILIATDTYGATQTPPEPEEPTEYEVSVYGYVANISDQEKNTPLMGVRVTLLGEDKNESLGFTLTDSDGMFRFDFTYNEDGKYYLRFDYSGYAVRMLPKLDMELDQDGDVRFHLSNDLKDSEGRYALTGSADSLHAIAMAITTGEIFGVVSGETVNNNIVYLEGATVRIVSESGQVYTVKTDSSGFFRFVCPYGTYVMTVSCNGFIGSSEMEVTTDHEIAYPVVLNQYTSEFLGMDIAHGLMVFGFLILAGILLAGILIARRSKMPDSGITVENDLTSNDEEEDLRHP